MPQDNDYGFIYSDLVSVLARNSNVILDASGHDALFKFITRAVVAEVQAGGNYFGDRLYYQSRFAGIGHRLNDIVPHDHDGTRDHVLSACDAEVHGIIDEIRAKKAAWGDAFDDQSLATRLCLQFDPGQVPPFTPPGAIGR